ncbi:MAG: FumA C-terminus/TtdB family hydratase beta subunit [Candidatus Bathyarchaeota archaeon]
MVTLKLKTPIDEQEIRKIRNGDILYISGTAITARDEAHIRAIEYFEHGKKLPVDFAGLVVYHCGPLMRKKGEGWEVLAAGPTTSARMDSMEGEFIEKFKPRVIIGKGGMGKKTADAAKKFGAIYCDFTGGAAVLAAKAIEKIQGVEWLDLGMPEALWILKINEFGPLVTTIDSLGNNLHDDLTREIEGKKAQILGV